MAETSTEDFLKHCEQINQCEQDVYLLIDGDPLLSKYSCLFDEADVTLTNRIVKWLRAHKAESQADVLHDVYSALDALRAENAQGNCKTWPKIWPGVGAAEG